MKLSNQPFVLSIGYNKLVRDTFYMFAAHAGLVNDVTDTDSKHTMAALTVCFRDFQTTIFNRERRRVKAAVYISGLLKSYSKIPRCFLNSVPL